MWVCSLTGGLGLDNPNRIFELRSLLSYYSQSFKADQNAAYSDKDQQEIREIFRCKQTKQVQANERSSS